MSKLFKIKEWLTIADAAKHLSLVFGEDVSEADVLRFALDGALKLSVNFVNGGRARMGRPVPLSEAEYEVTPSLAADSPPFRWYGGPVISIAGEEYALKLESDVISLRGIFDLPMIGGERHDVEFQFQALTGGPEVTMQSLDGAFVSAGESAIFQLQEDYDDNEYQRGSMASLQQLRIRIQSEDIPTEKANALLLTHSKDRKDFIESRKGKPKHEHFHPAGGLPDDCALVVRTRALTDFVATVNDEGLQEDRPLPSRERDSMLKLILGMALKAYVYDPKASKSPTPKEISDDLAEHGLNMSDDTVRKYLKQAASLFLSANQLGH